MKDGGQRCSGKASTFIPARAIEKAMIDDNGTVKAPETPAQALHLMTFAAQGKEIPEEAKEAAKSFDITSLTPQQMWVSWKGLAESKEPSRGLQTLHELGFEEHFPDLHAIRGVPQSPYWHPEGSVEKHLQEAGDVAAGISKRKRLNKKDTHVAVLGAICHDFGKSTHTQVDEKTGKITSYGHDKAGVSKAKAFLEQIGADEQVKKEIPVIVGEHMCHIQEPTMKSAHKLSERLKAGGTTLEAWTRVADSDIGGRGSASEPSIARQWLKAREDYSKQVEEAKGNEKNKSFINGKFLTSIGYTPGQHYRDMIHAGQKAVEEGYITDEKSAKDWFKENF